MAEVLGAATPEPAELLRARTGAGCSLQELAEWVGSVSLGRPLSISTIDAWEKARRPIPERHRVAVALIYEQLLRAGDRPLERRLEQIVAEVHKLGQLSVASVRHRYRIRRGGKQIQDPLTTRAIDVGLQRGATSAVVEHHH